MKPVNLKQALFVFVVCLTIGLFAGYFVGFMTR